MIIDAIMVWVELQRQCKVHDQAKRHFNFQKKSQIYSTFMINLELNIIDAILTSNKRRIFNFLNIIEYRISMLLLNIEYSTVF